MGTTSMWETLMIYILCLQIKKKLLDEIFYVAIFSYGHFNLTHIFIFFSTSHWKSAWACLLDCINFKLLLVQSYKQLEG